MLSLAKTMVSTKSVAEYKVLPFDFAIAKRVIWTNYCTSAFPWSFFGFSLECGKHYGFYFPSQI